VDKQKILNIVWRHFITESHPRAVDATGHCLYLTDDGRRCAIGVLLPAELCAVLPSNSIRGLLDADFATGLTPAEDVKTYLAETAPRLTAHLTEQYGYTGSTEDKSFLRQIQRCHDDAYHSRDGIQAALEIVAGHYMLQVPNAGPA
jgi:hypothetical protein